MYKNKSLLFVIVIFIQILILTGVVFVKLLVLGSGTEIALEIMPVDPRDPLRGDYATFNYGISQIPYYGPVSPDGPKDTSFSYGVEPRPGPVQNGTTIYVPLQKSEKYWIQDGEFTLEKPKDGIFIKGVVTSGGASAGGPLENNYRGGTLNVTYGIEEYFIPEGTGTTLNRLDGEAYAKVMVDEEGSAVLKQIYVNDKPWP